MTSARKHTVGDQYTKVRVHSASPSQVDCRTYSIKIVRSPTLKRDLAQMSNRICRKQPDTRWLYSVCFGGFDCRSTHACLRGEAGTFKVKVKRNTSCLEKEFLAHSNVLIHGQLAFQFCGRAPSVTWLLLCSLNLSQMQGLTCQVLWVCGLSGPMEDQ